jgi:hypothetical protein
MGLGLPAGHGCNGWHCGAAYLSTHNDGTIPGLHRMAATPAEPLASPLAGFSDESTLAQPGLERSPSLESPRVVVGHSAERPTSLPLTCPVLSWCRPWLVKVIPAGNGRCRILPGGQRHGRSAGGPH